jgi:phosphoglycolate phosphatase-like HAD superfamily hydrolase
MGKRYQTCIFDLDGTLLDSKKGFEVALNQALREHEIFPLGHDLASFIGPPIRTILRKALPEMPERLIEPVVARYRELFDKQECLNAALYQGVHEVLSSLTADEVLLILATNKPRRATDLVVDHFEIRKYFASVMCPDPRTHFNLTKEELMSKAMENVNASKEQLLVVGDSMEDFKAALSVGGDFAAALYGYGGAMLRSQMSTLSLEKLEDLLYLISK